MWHWIKEHPIIVVGGLGAIVLLWLVVRSGSGSSGGTTTVAAYPQPSDAAIQAAAGLSAAQIAGNTQTTAASLQAGVQNAAIQGSVAETNAQTGAQVSIAQTQANEAATASNNAVLANASNNATTLAVSKVNAAAGNFQAEQAANVQQAGIAATASVQNAGIQSQSLIALANDATQAQMAAITANVANTSSTNALIAARSNNAALVDMAAINASTAQSRNPTVDYGQSIANLEGAISSTGSIGAGLLPEVQAAASGGANAGAWGTITGIVQNWGSRTTNAKNQAGKSTILGALNTPVYGTPTAGSFITNLLPV